MKLIPLLFIFFTSFFSANKTSAQCTTLGLTPSTAIPVCGTSVFRQDQVFDCGNQNVAQSFCAIGVTSERSFWYKFRCFQSGTLGFLISGLNSADDYDWILYDVTGQNPNAVFSNASLQVSMNIYGTIVGTSGGAPFDNSPTGCKAGASGDFHCEGDAPGNTPYNRMPAIIIGHDYLLMVANFSQSFIGYDLSFGGGTASITDPKDPNLESARAACDGKETTIKLNKRMKCASLLADGSEFTISPPIANVISAVAIGCTGSFDMDSLLLTLDAPLPPGTYDITIRTGADGNTIVDNCNKGVPDGETIPVTIFPQFPTPMDSITKVIKCAPDEVEFVFRKRIRCASVAPNGSDFVITGTSPVTILSAAGFNCDAKGLSNIIRVKFTQPIQVKGNFNITLQTGIDGTTIIDECGKESIPGQSLSFNTKDTVNADFAYNILYGCKRDTINYLHNGLNEVTSWKWDFDDLRRSALQNPQILYGTFGLKTAQLIVSNGTCTDTSAKISIVLPDAIKAKFEATTIVCPNDLATFTNTSTGNISNYLWHFGDNTTSILPNPLPHIYSTNLAFTDVLVKLVVSSSTGCKDSSFQKIRVAGSCFIAVPNAFTPNGDGLNDFLYPLNAYKVKDLLFRVYNRFGQMVFETRDWLKQWDGKFKGQGADPATYVWMLSFINPDTGKRIEQKGTSILIR